MSKIIYYYQTFRGLDDILVKNTPVTHIHVASVHFGYDNNNQPYIHLNDHSPYNERFDGVWSQIRTADELGIKVVLMLGGAGGGYHSLFSNFNLFYNLLYQLLKNKPYIKGIDLDIEEEVDLDEVKKLINSIVLHFGEDYIISTAPVQEALEQDIPGIGGFCYKTLLSSPEGKYIDYINGQFYNDFSLNAYNMVVQNGYHPSLVVMGTMDSDVSDEVREIVDKYPNTFGGVYFWEYPFVEPDALTWAKTMQNIITPSFSVKVCLNNFFNKLHKWFVG